MNRSTPDSPKPKEAASILLVGPPGGGKTTLALQFPNVYLAMCDPKTANAPERYIREKVNPGLEFAYDVMYQDEKGEALPIHEHWDKFVRCIKVAIKDPWVKTIVLDSLTAIDEMLLNHLLKKVGREAMEQRDWIPFRMELKEMMLKVRSTNKVSIVTAHEKLIYNTKAEVISHKIVLSSRLSDYFGWLFTDVWRCYSLPSAGGKQTYHIQTNRDGLNDLKNSVKMPFTVQDVSFKKVNEYLKLEELWTPKTSESPVNSPSSSTTSPA